MQNEVMVNNNQTAKLPAVSAETTALLSMIERVCLDPSADIDKLSKMLDMQERILNRNAEQAFAADFAAMQSELPRIARNGTIEIKKDGRITQSTPFAKLEDINDGVRPTLQKYGFGVSFSIAQAGGMVTVTAKLLHRLGHSEITSISLPLDNTGSKNAVQSSGSSVSYGKRYTMCALLNISTGDDVDGHHATPEEKPAGIEYLSEDDVFEILSLLAENKITKEKFVTAAGVPEIAKIQKHRFEICKKWIAKESSLNANN